MAEIDHEPKPKRLGPDEERALMAQVARMYYLDDVSRVDIADWVGISRFRVARLLQRAKETGLVTIAINDPGVADPDLAIRIQQGLGIDECVVVRSGGSPTDIRQQVGLAAAKVLGDSLRKDDVLGIAWGRTLTETSNHLKALPKITVVQLAGSLSGDLSSSPIEIARQVSQRSGGAVYPIFSPLIMTQAATAKALRAQPDISSAMALFDSVTTALLAVGSWSSGQSQMLDVMGLEETTAMRSKGAVGDIAGIIINERGGVVDPSFQERCIAIGYEQLRKIPQKIAVAAGSGKAGATIAAARGGLITGLVVDSDLANAILSQLAETP